MAEPFDNEAFGKLLTSMEKHVPVTGLLQDLKEKRAEKRGRESFPKRLPTPFPPATFPCFQCARYILDAGIKSVVYVEAYPILESRKFLTDNGVEVIPFEGFKARAFNTVFRRVD